MVLHAVRLPSLVLALSLSLAGCAVYEPVVGIVTGPVTPAGAPAASPAPGAPAAPEAGPVRRVAGAALRGGKPVAGARVMVYDALTGKLLAAARPGRTLMAAAPPATDGAGGFALDVPGVPEGHPVRVAVETPDGRLEATADGEVDLKVDEAATALAMLERGLYEAAGAMAGADRRFGATAAPLDAVRAARRKLAAIAAGRQAIVPADPAAARADAEARLAAFTETLAADVVPALAPLTGPAADPARLLARRAALGVALAEAAPDLAAVLAKLADRPGDGAFPGLLAAFARSGDLDLLAAFRAAPAEAAAEAAAGGAAPAAPGTGAAGAPGATVEAGAEGAPGAAPGAAAEARAAAIAARLDEALLAGARAERDAFLATADDAGRRALALRLLGGGGVRCVDPAAAARLALGEAPVRGLLEGAFAGLDDPRSLKLWEAIAADPVLGKLAGGMTATEITCAAPVVRRRALRDLFAAIAALDDAPRQAALVAFVRAAAPVDAYQDQLAGRLARLGDPGVRALLLAFGPTTAAGAVPLRAAAFDVRAGNLTGAPALAVPPDPRLAAPLAALAGAVAEVLAEPAPPADPLAIAFDADTRKAVATAIAEAVRAIAAEAAARHARVDRPWPRPIPFPGTSLVLDGGADGPVLRNRDTGAAVGLDAPDGAIAGLVARPSGGSGGGHGSAGAPPTDDPTTTPTLPPLSGRAE